jgi:hypothetical protein
MTTDRMLVASLDEPGVCRCEDPFGLAGFAKDCPGHQLHRRIGASVPATSPLAAALVSLAELHVWHPAPGPVESPTGSCGACGGTGEIFRGWAAEGGPIFEGECGAPTSHTGERATRASTRR